VFGTRVRRSENYEIDLSDPVATTVRFTQGALTYQDSREELHTTYDEQAYDDLPDKDTYIRALVVAGGLVDIENREDVETFFRRQGYPDLDAGHQPVALGIDTNLLAWRMPDVLRLDPERYSDDKGRSPVNGFALATGIYEELNWHYNHYETRPLEDAFDPSSLGWTISRLGRIVKGSSGSTSTAVSAIIGMRIRSRVRRATKPSWTPTRVRPR